MAKTSQENIEHCGVLTTSTRETYNAVGSIYCPVLKVDVVFNARGFHHLLYNSNGKARDVKEIIL